jgi:hypothetical protein
MNTTDFLNYCKSNIEDFGERRSFAINEMYRKRDPLWMVAEELSNDMQNALEDYCYDNDLNPEDYDIEEIIWED